MTGIEWCDETWNCVTGCDKVSPGCDHCYALTMAKRLKGMGQTKYQNDGDPRTSGPGFGLTVHPDVLDLPLRWRKPRRVFVNSMSDLFHDGVPDEFIAKVFGIMALARRHTFQILTKRPGRMRSLLNSPEFALLALAEMYRQQEVSAPGLDPWRLPGDLPNPRTPADGRLGWIIVGGESGPGARPMHADWARSLRDQCQAAGVPFFFKQHGEWMPLGPLYGESAEMDVARLDAMYYERRQIAQVEPDGTVVDPEARQPVDGTWLMARVGKKAAGRHLDGRTWDQYPEITVAGGRL